MTGSSIAEFGPTLFLALGIIVLPLLAFGILGMRYTFLLNAARLAAQQAARAKTFLADTSSTDLSAVDLATKVANSSVNNIGGNMVAITSVNTFVKVCPLAGGTTAVTTPGANKALTTPANTSTNTYSCEVVILGSLQPLFPGGKSMLGSIPGFNAPIVTTVRSDCFFESTSNLNQ
jgi:Flp pilus assembly protein TadG